MGEETKRRKWGGDGLAILLVCFGGFLIAGFKLSSCFSSGVFQSWDLHAHVVLIGRLRAHLFSGQLSFFDPWWFGGWSAFSYYAPFAHISGAVLASVLAALGIPEPDQTSAQLLLGVLFSALPLSLFFSARRVLNSHGGKQNGFWIAGFSLLLGLWFLRHSDEHFGIGVNGGVRLGLFPQVFAWHFFLLYIGELMALSVESSPQSRRISPWLSVLLALLILTHSLTFLSALGFGIAVMMWKRSGKELWLSHLLGISLSAFWFLPASIYGGAFSPGDKVRSAGGLLSLLFPESCSLMLRRIFSGELYSVSLLPPIFVFGFFLLLTRRTDGDNSEKRGSAFLALSFVLSILMSSDYFGISVPFSLHLYRILVVFLLVTLILMLVALTEWVSQRRRMGFWAILLCVACFQEFSLFPAIPSFSERAREFAGENVILEKLRSDGKTSAEEERVFVEHLGRSDKPEIRSPHYLSTRLEAESGREAATGLFVQSSLSQAYPAFASKRLKIHSYNAKQAIGLSDHAERPQLFGRLREFGVNTLVLDASETKKDRPDGGEVVGKYRIIHLDDPENVSVFSKQKELLGYLNESGTLAFREFEAFFYGIDPLWKRFSLLEIRDSSHLPGGLSGLIVNGNPPIGVPPGLPLVQFQFQAESLLKFPMTWERADDLDFERESKLIRRDNLIERLVGLPSHAAVGELFPPLRLNESEGRIELSKLVPGKFYRVNYSYAPFWKAQGALLFRGDAERMWLLAESTEASLNYRVWTSPSVALGSILSGLSCVLLLILRRKSRRDYISSSDIEKSGSSAQASLPPLS